MRLFLGIYLWKSNVVPSLDLLKQDIISLIRPESKSFFNVHDPTGLRYLFQLRLRLSPLNGHKYCHNFIDTPSGTCQGIEDTSHFLLFCPSYNVQRVTLLTYVNEILLEVNFDYHYNYNYNNPYTKSILTLSFLLFIKSDLSRSVW